MGKAKCQRENPWNSQLPFLSFSPIMKIFQNVVELVIAWSGESMGSNFEFGENQFWLLEQESTQKCMPICSYTHVLHLLMPESLGAVLSPWFCWLCVLPSRFGLLDFFPHLQNSTLCSLSNGWKFPKCEIHNFGLLCISSSRGQLFFIFWSLRISFLWCSCGWVLPQLFLLHFPNVYQVENRFCVAQRFWGETTSSWVLLMNSFLATLGPKRP